MATSGAVVNGSVAEASAVFADAVRAAGGTVSSQLPGQPIRFTIKRPGNIWEGKNTPYEGTANLVPLSAGQTRIDVAVSCSAMFYLYLGLGVIFVFLLAYWLSPLIVLLGLVAVVWSAFQAAGPWAQEVANHVIAALPSAAIAVAGASAPAPAATAAPAAATSPAANPAPPHVSDPVGSADVADQLKKLGELHATGVLTDEEFQTKKAELLKRL
jgi:Short C-terminal domain